ncbi:MAG: acetylxylan esterase, partial [Verrucomicrobiota bacterium]|nr:acetylxylan esterase [Verrucomicrobiota bacterium]
MKIYFFLFTFLGTLPLLISSPRALSEGSVPKDKRLLALKDLNGYFSFEPPQSVEEWSHRSAKIRHQLKVAAGLYPEPSKCPLNAVVRDRTDHGDFTVEKVFFETLPGYYLTGTLYRPKDSNKKRPGVLCPHGHWKDARFYDAGEEKAKQQIDKGAESNIESARNPYQSRCIGLARLGCTVFQYDMIGNSDNHQISYEIAHRFAKQRPAMISEKKWGLYSPQAESHLQSIMMLQTWNSIRAIDFMQGLEDVDPDRIAVTGASGGGTQTFMVSALDPRVKVSMPAVMVSTAMQGGCTCENAALLRVNEGNIAFAALFAPKPLGLTAADDWTKEMATKGFPEIKKTYQVLGAPQNTMLHNRIEFEHNYNLPSRQAVYGWFNKHLELGSKEPENERPHTRLSKERLSVWDKEHPMPRGGDEFEVELLQSLAKDIKKKVESDPKIARMGWDAILDSDLGRCVDVEWDLVVKNERDGYLEMSGLIKNTTCGEQVPAIFLYPDSDWNKRAVIWLSGSGKDGLYEGDELRKEVKKLLLGGSAVCGIDLFMQGEFLEDGKEHKVTTRVKNNREAAAYTFGYNSTLFVHRIRDVLTTIKMIQSDKHGARKIDLVGLRGAGHWAAAANYAARGAIDRAVIETGEFKFIKIRSIRDPDFLPGSSRYGDIEALISYAKTGPWVVDSEGLPDWI